MGKEDDFAAALAQHLRFLVPDKYTVETKRSLLYAISFDDDGHLRLGQDADLQPTRGGGTGFEQDLVIFERVKGGDTAIVPRVSVEVKFGRMHTHDSIVYSEKARRIRTIYPFVRYGLILGDLQHIPPRTLRLGTEFDFIATMASPIDPAALKRIVTLLKKELDLSCAITKILRGRTKVVLLHRSLQYSKAPEANP